MKKINIALVIDRSFESRDYKRYGVSSLSKFFNVYVLDCSCIVNKDTVKAGYNQSVTKIFNFDECVVLLKYKSISKFLEDKSISFYFDLMGVGFPCARIRRIMHIHRVSRIKLFLGELPQLYSAKSFVSRLKTAVLKGRLILRIFEYVIRKLFIQKLEPKVDMSIYSGSICKTRYQKNIDKGIVWAHSLDYQVYLEVLKSKYEYKNEKNYAVFLDQNAPSHPDYSFHKNKPPVTENYYYKSLNNFFDDFENRTGIEVIIASHPRSSANEHPYQWNNRKSIIGKTPWLIEGATLVFAHYSTAISFAVLWKKPIIQLTTSEYNESYRHERFVAFSTALNLKPLNVDDYEKGQIMDKYLFHIDKVAYEKYEELYLKSKYSKSRDLWSIVADNINQYKELKN